MIGTKVQSESGLPHIIMFPSGKKTYHYEEYKGRPFTDEMIDFFIEKAENGVSKKRFGNKEGESNGSNEFEGIGRRGVDE